MYILAINSLNSCYACIIVYSPNDTNDGSWTNRASYMYAESGGEKKQSCLFHLSEQPGSGWPLNITYRVAS